MDKDALLKMLKHYEDTLCKNVFNYTLNDKITIQLLFYKEQFCHLLGIQHVFNNSKDYLGMRGYQKIINGRLTFDAIKAHNGKVFNYLKPKFNNFNSIYDVLTKGNFIKFYNDRCRPTTALDADFFAYKNNDTDAMLHLFIRQERNKQDIYAPTSFIVKLNGDKDYNQFTLRQERKNITYTSVIRKSEHL